MLHYPVAEVDLASIAHNLAVVQKHAPNSKILAMLSGNAYGHGLIPVARCLRKANAFGVNRLSSAMKLRKANFDKERIMISQGVFGLPELEICVEQRFDIVVHSWNQIRDLDNLQASEPNGQINVWLKLDVGLHGLGFQPTDFNKAYHHIRELPCVNELILFADLSQSENTDQESVKLTHEEINLFQGVTKDFSDAKSLVGSAGLISFPEAHYDWVRPGVILFGVRPPVLTEDLMDAEITGRPKKEGETLKSIYDRVGCYWEWNLWAAMTVKSRIIAIRTFSKESGTSNGSVGQKGEIRVGVVQFGFADGYPSQPETETQILINGQQAPIMPGGIYTNSIFVDLSRLPSDVDIGDEVIFWGPGLPIEKLCETASLSPAALLCSLGNSLSYKYRNAEYYFTKVWNISIDGDEEEFHPNLHNGVSNGNGLRPDINIYNGKRIVNGVKDEVVTHF